MSAYLSVLFSKCIHLAKPDLVSLHLYFYNNVNGVNNLIVVL